MIHVTIPTTGHKMSIEDMALPTAAAEHLAKSIEQLAKRRPSAIAKELREALNVKAEQDKIVESLEKELSECVQERSIVGFSAWENSEFVHYHAIITPGSFILDYITEAK